MGQPSSLASCICVMALRLPAAARLIALRRSTGLAGEQQRVVGELGDRRIVIATEFHRLEHGPVRAVGADFLFPVRERNREMCIALGPPSGPVYLGIPTDLLSLETGAHARRSRRAHAPAGGAAHAPPRNIDEAVDLLQQSERPLIWAWRGIRCT